MARASYGRGGGAGAGPAPAPRRVDPKLKLYNLIRWMNYLLFPLVGMGFVVAGLIYAFMADDIKVPLTLIAGGGILAYVSIFYNKR